MNLIPIDASEIRNGKKIMTNLYRTLEEFSKMDCECVYIDWEAEGYADVFSLYSSLRKSVQRHGFAYRVIMHDRKVYLLKESIGA